MSEKADEGKVGAEGDASISFPYDVMAELNDSKFGQTIQVGNNHLRSKVFFKSPTFLVPPSKTDEKYIKKNAVC